MVRIGGVIVIGAILTVIGISFLFYSDEVLTDVKVSNFGEPIQVGDIMFDIQYVANFEYLEKTKEFKIAEQAEIDRGLIEASNEKPEYTYFQIDALGGKYALCSTNPILPAPCRPPGGEITSINITLTLAIFIYSYKTRTSTF